MSPKYATAQRECARREIITTAASLRSKSMDTNAQVPQRFLVESSSASLDVILPIDARADDDVRRSEDNILQWMSYLPEDCIRTMIAMGWDIST
jgi:hypothetical protein